MATTTKRVCNGSGEAVLSGQWGRAGDYIQDRPDENDRVKCPCCGKVVKLRRDWPQRGWASIPRHLEG
jgi:hypothetical protein